MKHILNIEISWTGKNYSCGWGFEGIGAVLCTNKTIDGLKKDFEKSLRFHIEAMVVDGEAVPDWLALNKYEVEYTLS